ncbi:hypothetical protein CEXT_562081 [Caerostris extrusa]|uniref:Uncharacterized protein n=1 Tax=Caerostris extrusa TaxID=172846 RepID=A0AAV4XVC1_CAEEX|nr:hypothetical protein CEXT_562081 [Caerostris extrusa]
MPQMEDPVVTPLHHSSQSEGMKSTCHFPKQCAASPRIRRLLLGRKQSKARRAICFPRPAINIQPVSTLQRSLRCTQKRSASSHGDIIAATSRYKHPVAAAVAFHVT